MTELAHIVCFGRDPTLLQTRQAVLSRHFHVTAVDTLEAMQKLTCSFDVIVLCHTLSEVDHQQAITFLRNCCPHAGIVALIVLEAGHCSQGSQHIVRGLDGPEALIAAVYATLREKRLDIPEPKLMLDIAALAHQ